MTLSAKVYTLDFDACDNIDGCECIDHNFIHKKLVTETLSMVVAAFSTSLLREPLMYVTVVMAVSIFLTPLCNCRTFHYCDTSDGSGCLCLTSIHMTVTAYHAT